MNHIETVELGKESQLKVTYILHIDTSIIHPDRRHYISYLFLGYCSTYTHVDIVLRKGYSVYQDIHQYLDMPLNHEVPLKSLWDVIGL